MLAILNYFNGSIPKNDVKVMNFFLYISSQAGKLVGIVVPIAVRTLILSWPLGVSFPLHG